VKVRLPEPLHARPATLLVRLSSHFAAQITLRAGTRSANAKDILEVLALSAMKDDEIELLVVGLDAGDATDALHALIERGFDADLVPESGSAGAPGIAVGHAIVLGSVDSPSTVERPKATVEEELARAEDAIDRAIADVEALVNALPEAEATLFAPEVEILRSLAPQIALRVAQGLTAEAAVAEETPGAAHDLVLDARARLLGALSGGRGRLVRALAVMAGEVVLVARELTPSVVASLPDRVVAIVATEDAGAGPMSHAAILARGRGLPLAYVAPHVVDAIATGDLLVVDATKTPALVWATPSEALANEARARRSAHLHAAHEAATSAPSLQHIDVALRVNIASLRDDVPRGADGIGLVRTELVFAGRSAPPSELEQAGAYGAIAAKARGARVTVRLFDAGGDKPTTWLPSPVAAPGARGIELLRHHEAHLLTQLRAASRARARADIRVLIPLVRGADDVLFVRELAERSLPIGAMIESVVAADNVESIVEVADFVCIGSNDLAAAVLDVSRAQSMATLHPRVLTLIARIVAVAHARSRKVTVCGEIAGEERAAMMLIGVGVDALSVAPPRVHPIALALAATTMAECRAAAALAMSASS
jgi:phosphotransferase system HPr (HPr) family protein